MTRVRRKKYGKKKNRKLVRVTLSLGKHRKLVLQRSNENWQHPWRLHLERVTEPEN